MATVHLDNRTLEPPEPMVRILRELPSLGDDDELVALMDREPVFLFADLQRRGFEWNMEPDGDGFRLTIRKERP